MTAEEYYEDLIVAAEIFERHGYSGYTDTKRTVPKKASKLMDIISHAHLGTKANLKDAIDITKRLRERIAELEEKLKALEVKP